MTLAPTLYDLELSLTFVGDHVHADCDGQSFDGPLTRAAP